MTQLNILCSARVRLTEDQRETLKQAHNKLRAGYTPPVVAPVMAGSSVSVETFAQAPHDIYTRHGMSSIVVTDLIVSRDSISLPVLHQLQNLLGVNIITKTDLKKAFDGYLKHILDAE
tara:strand:- start:1022 stop:1375 length:354 start_codon:yes stop_codon:yes gene_type:complete